MVGEFKETTGEIITDVVEMGWNGVCAASEIEVVREVEFIGEELFESKM